MARQPAGKGDDADARKANRKKVQAQLDASAARVEALVTAARKRRQAQRDAGDTQAARRTLKYIDRLRQVENDILRTRIKLIDESDEMAALIAGFKQINKDMSVTRNELQDMARDLNRAAKVIGALEKLVARAALL